MKKMINTERIEGRVYQHSLAVKTVSNQASANYGKEFIGGEIEIAVDEEGLNVIPVHFSYVTEKTSSGKTNATYGALKRIIDGKTWVSDGPENAIKVRVDTALALNDFYTQDDQLVSTKRNEGGFVTIIDNLTQALNERNTFSADMLISNIVVVEANPEKNVEEDYVSVRGHIFNFRNDILPMEFVVTNKDGMKYFEGLEVSPAQPIFTKVWGRINCQTIKQEVVEDSAFGEASVKTYERKTKQWVITGTSKVAYDYGDERVLTQDEVQKANQNREVALAEVKRRSDEYRANKGGQTATPAPSVAPKAQVGGFNF